MDWIDFFGILTWLIIFRMYYRYVTKQTNTTNENRGGNNMRYTTVLEEGLSFGDAMNALMKGKKVTRAVWGGFWCKQALLGKQDTKLPEWSGQFIVAALKEGGYAPAQPYQADMFANDWMVVG